MTIASSLSSVDLCSGLNDPQLQAVLHIGSPLLILAGAGTGKTRVLTTRIAHILSTYQAYPSEILAVTFTNKAATQMRTRVADALGHDVEGLWLGTFHSLCARSLRRHAELVNLTPQFTILNTDDQLRLVKDLVKVENLDDRSYPPRAYVHLIGRYKDRGLGPTEDPISQGTLPLFQKIYASYQERLRILNAVDFGDLILHMITILKKHPDVLATYHKKFKFILVDEYQDTNVAQYLWLRLLAQGGQSICCVGDDDQSIYGWRGAEIKNILRFEKDFLGARIIRLEQNYRSTPEILGAASSLIAKNSERLGKTLWTDAREGEKIRVNGLWSADEEARFVCEEIENLHRKKHMLSQIAILVRAGFQTRSFEERLITLGIPYRVIGGARFYERLEIRDAIAYLRIVLQPRDGLAFERILNTPKRGIGATTLQGLHDIAREASCSLPEAAFTALQTGRLRGSAATGLKDLLFNLERWRHLVCETKPADMAKIILDESGYTTMWRNDKSPEAPGRLENLKELISAIQEFPTLEGFLEHISLVMENTRENQDDQVLLMTLHGAKGLEFETVFLAGWEENLFPHGRVLSEEGTVGLEEERRLAYVGITRARKRLHITYAINRQIYNQWVSSIPSRFLSEINPDLLLWEGKENFFSQTSLPPEDTSRRFFSSASPQSSLSHTGLSSHSRKGEKVFHEKFGYGRILSSEGNSAEVAFEKAGIKKIMTSFLKPIP